MTLRIDERRRTVTSNAGGGFLLLFGAVFAAAGGVFIYMLVTGGDVTVNGRPGTPSDAWLPGIFVLVGAAVGLSRYQKVVDLRRQTVRRSFRLLVPLWSREEALGAPDKVTLSREVRGSGKNRRTVYPVRLASGSDETEVYAGGSADRARLDAEALAKLVNAPLHDLSEGAVFVRTPEELDRSVLDIQQDDTERPVPPPDSSVAVTGRARGVTIRLPAARAPLLLGVAGLAVVGGVTFVFWLSWRSGFGGVEGLGERLFYYAPLLMAGVALLGATVAAARRGVLGTTLEIDRRELVARSSFRRTRIPAEHIEELRLVGHGMRAALLIRSDEQSVRCGRGLSDEDREYLRGLILYHLPGR